MSIADTVTVTISVQDVAPAIADFGTPLILAYHTHFVGVRTYEASPTGLAAMVTDGFTTHDPAYYKAAAICSQSPHTDKFKVANRLAANVQTFKITPKWYMVGRTISVDVTVGGVTTVITRTPIGVSLAAEATALQVLLDPINGLTAVDSTGYVTCTATVPAVRCYLRNIVGLDVEDTSADNGIAADIAAASAADNDWFGLLIDSESPAEITLAAAFALTNEKIFGAISADASNFTAADGIAHDIKALINHNTYVIATRDTLGCAEAGLMGRQFSRRPGSDTWAHKQISGAVADGLSGTEFSNARANGAITYVNDGVSHTYDGFACSGRYLDIARGIAWLRSSIRIAVLIVLVNNEKIAFTNAGAALIEAALAGVLSQGESYGLIAPGWTTSRPDVSTVATSDKLSRTFPDMKFSGVLQGAIQKVIIDGTLTV
jgi:hypothetical protein